MALSMVLSVISTSSLQGSQNSLPLDGGRLGGGGMTGKLTKIAGILRQRSTEAERALWRKLRGRQLEGYKFRRQQPVGPYIVDFVNFEKGIIIELDGGQHVTNRARDEEREAWLRDEGFQIIRFWNNDVFDNMEGVLEVILRELTVPLP